MSVLLAADQAVLPPPADVLTTAFWIVTVCAGSAVFVLAWGWFSDFPGAQRLLIWLGCWVTVLYLALLIAYLWLVSNGSLPAGVTVR